MIQAQVVNNSETLSHMGSGPRGVGCTRKGGHGFRRRYKVPPKRTFVKPRGNSDRAIHKIMGVVTCHKVENVYGRVPISAVPTGDEGDVVCDGLRSNLTSVGASYFLV